VSFDQAHPQAPVKSGVTGGVNRGVCAQAAGQWRQRGDRARKTRRLTEPVLAIGGAEGIGEGAANTMRLAAEDVQSVVIPGCGHYCLEEAPQEILATLTAFLAPYRESI
jgi:pimeloyl-ACP methyl ester carboxylesterase